MTLTGLLPPVLQLMRPAQWPILTVQLALGMILALPPGSATNWSTVDGVTILRLGSAWLCWVVLLNGGTLAFNSAYDRDTGPVAYLACPPRPPAGLARLALVMMMIGAVLGWFLVGRFFGSVVGVCTLLSVLYSHPTTRWKSRPGLDLLTNILGYGAGTTLAGLSAQSGGVPTSGGWLFATGFGLLFGSLYPLTQIYQIEDDRSRGDTTLATTLGLRRSLLVALGLGVLAGAVLWVGAAEAVRGKFGGLLIAALVLWCAHLVRCVLRGEHWSAGDHERAMYGALGLWGVIDIALALVWLT